MWHHDKLCLFWIQLWFVTWFAISNRIWWECNYLPWSTMQTLIWTPRGELYMSLDVIPWTLPWRHNGRDNVSNHQPHDCLLNRLFRRRSKKKSTLRVTGLCAWNSPGTVEFPAQMASNAENVSIWWRHHGWTYVHMKRRRLDIYLTVIFHLAQPWIIGT